MGDIYENITAGEDSDSDFPSEDENELEGSNSPSEHAETSNENTRFSNAQSHLSDHLFSQQRNNTLNPPDPEDYEQPEFEDISNGKNRFASSQSNHFSNLPEQDDYEEPEEFIKNGNNGAQASSFPRTPFLPRGPANLPPPLFSQNSPFRQPSYPPPLKLNLSPRIIRPRQINPSLVGHRPRKINPPVRQFSPRFGNPRPTLPNFGSPRSFVQSPNIRLPDRPQLHQEIRPAFHPFNVRHKMLPHLRQSTPRVNDSIAQPSSKIKNFDHNSPAQGLKKSSLNAPNPLLPTMPKPLPSTHLQKFNSHQNSNQNINIRQAGPLNTRKKTPPLVKEIVSFPERPTWREKQSNSNNSNKLPAPPMLPKPVFDKKFSQISSVHPKPDTSISSDEKLVSSLETLQLDSGEKIPMNELYKTLLNEKYFHPISKESTLKYLTEGTFLLRPSRTHTDEKPLTLVLKHNGTTYIFSVEKRKSGLYSIGSEKQGELAFSTIQELIAYYHDNAFHFEGHKTYFLHPAMKPSG